MKLTALLRAIAWMVISAERYKLGAHDYSSDSAFEHSPYIWFSHVMGTRMWLLRRALDL
jgi:hypothetical protein